MALIGMIESALKSVPDPAKERAALEQEMQKRAAFEAMLGNIIPALECCDDQLHTVCISNISPKIRELVDTLKSMESPNFPELYNGRIESLADLFELACAIMNMIAGADDYNASIFAPGSKAIAAGSIDNSECIFRVSTKDGQIINDPDGNIARAFMDAVATFNAAMVDAGNGCTINGYMFSGIVEEDGTINEINSCFKVDGACDRSWMSMHAQAASESTTLLERYRNQSIQAYRVSDIGLESFHIDSNSIYGFVESDASAALEQLKGLHANSASVENSIEDQIHGLTTAIEEGLPQTAQEYDPTADLEEIEQTLAGIDQTNPELDPDQPQPGEQADKVTDTIANTMASPQDTEDPESAGKLE